MKRMIIPAKLKYAILFIIPILLYLSLFHNYFFKSSYLFGFGEWYSPYSLEHLKDTTFSSLFLHSSQNWGLPNYYPLIIIFYGTFLLFSYILGIEIAQKVIIFLIFYLLFLSSFLLFKKISKKELIAYTLSIIFSLNPFILNHLILGHVILLISMVNLMFSSYFLILFYETKNKLYMIATLLFFCINPVHPLYIPFFIGIFFLMGLYCKIPIKKNILTLLFISGFFVLIHLFWILNLLLGSNSTSEIVTYRGADIDAIKAQSKNVFNSFLNSEYFDKSLFLNNETRFQQIYDFSRILFWILLILLIIYSSKNNKPLFFCSIIFILILMLLLTGFYNPFGSNLFYSLLTLKVYRLYREVYHFTFLLIPVTFILFSYLLSEIKEKYKKIENLMLIGLILILILTGISLIPYSQNASLSKKVYSWNQTNLEENSQIYNQLCNYKTSDYVLLIPFYYTTYDKRTGSSDLEGGADSLISNSCFSSIGNQLPLNYPFSKMLGLFESNSSNQEVFSNLGISYVIIRKDFISGNEARYNSEYIAKKIENDKNMELVEITDKLIVYKNKYNQGLIHSDNSSFKKINPTKYHVYIQNLNISQNISFLESYHDSWNMYLVKNPSNSKCKQLEFYSNTNTAECEPITSFFEGEELSYLYQEPIFEDSHQIIYEYANGWTIDPQYIKENYSPEYYKQNADGSINIELVVYFKPQSYYYLGLIITGITLVISLGCLLIWNWKKQK